MRFFVFALFLTACSEEPKPVEEPVVPEKTTITHYTLERGDVISHGRDLPLQKPVYIKWYAGDQLLEKEHAYNLWDIDHDGRFDMVEKIPGEFGSDLSLDGNDLTTQK